MIPSPRRGFLSSRSNNIAGTARTSSDGFPGKKAPRRGRFVPVITNVIHTAQAPRPWRKFRALAAWGNTIRWWLSALLLVSGAGAVAAQENNLGIQVQEGFDVTLYADDALAHDIYCMTVDSLGRVVVAGPGYVKILIDADRDGVAESAKIYTDQLPAGAQGLCFLGRDLICSANDGVVRYRDRNGDDRADGPPEVFLKIKTGNEHDLHAIRKGPDGWWYAIAGNASGVTFQYAALPGSPVKKPHAGVILRMKPDLSAGEIYAHGLRNAYDFDFSESGDLYTFDSDGEKVISLPWYRPTRVLQMPPGAHAGWVTNDWIRADQSFDMPPILASLGRGSPTGVSVYRHTTFPDVYHGALFLLDWTYGNIYALPLKKQGSGWQTQPIEFLKAVGQHGFAPTDLEIGPQGELYVCTGGRGTRGAVYCIRSRQKSPKFQPWPGGSGIPVLDSEKLTVCLRAPQPLSSWARRVWEPLAAQLTSGPFIKAALEESRPPRERVRAIEILTELFNGLDHDLAAGLTRSHAPEVRARAAWSMGRSQPRTPNTTALSILLEDSDPQVVRAALEALIGADHQAVEELIPALGRQLAHPDRGVRQATMRVMASTSGTNLHKLAQVGFPQGWQAAIPVAAAHALASEGFSGYSVEIGTSILLGDYDDSMKVDAVRILQMGLGDLAPSAGNFPPVYDGYAPRLELSAFEKQMAILRKALSSMYPTGIAEADWELERVIAMVQPADPLLFQKVLEKITPNSSPVEDIHRLIVLSRLPVIPTASQRTKLADAMVHLSLKVTALQLPQDSDWDERMLEMYDALSQRDPALPLVVLEHPDFGMAGHVQLVRKLPSPKIPEAVRIFSRRIQSDPEYVWNSDVVFLLAASTSPADKERIREKFSDYSLRNAVLATLAGDPEERDRALFLNGLESTPVETMLACISALQLLAPSTSPAENVLIAQRVRTLGDRDEERQARDQLVELLRRNLNEDHGYILGRDGDSQHTAIAAWMKAVQQRFPQEFAQRAGGNEEDLEALSQRLARISWTNGNVTHGQQLYQQRGCAQCHGQSRALGPPLQGVAGRFSKEDLFTAIVLPSRDVSPRYQTTQIATTDGHIRTGMILYEAIDALALRDANYQTYRIATSDIEARRTLTQSLMPNGLLRGLSDQDLADLYAYLQNLGQHPTAGAAMDAQVK